MWLSTETESVAAPTERVWEIIRDVTALPRWHHFFAAVELDARPAGEQPSVRHGRYQPTGWFGPVHARTAGPFSMSLGDRSVVLRQPQPGRGEQIFSWWVAPGDGSTRVIQRVRVSGRYAPVVARLVGRQSARDFAEDVRRLAGLLRAPQGGHG